MGSIEFNGQACQLREPPEPETLFWDRLQIQAPEQRKRSCAVLAATMALLSCGFFGVITADILKGNLDYLVGCQGHMTVDPSAPDGTLGFCDPFTMHDTSLNEADIAAQQHYSESFEALIDAIGPDGQFPRAATRSGEAATASTFPDDYQCALSDSTDMTGCCEHTDGGAISY